MKKTFLFLVAIVTVILTSCSGYNRVVKSDDYGAKFEMANQLYDAGKEVKSIALYEQVYQRMPKTGEGELSYFRIGKAYYIGEDFYMAGYYLGMFSKRFASSPKAEEAMFLSALCGVQESVQPSLDQNATELAISDLQQFIDRFPNSNLIDSSNHIIDRLRFKLEVKDFDAVKLYDKTMYYRAAVSSSLTFEEEHPMSVFHEENIYILAKNSYFLAKHSVNSKKMQRIEDAIERYRTFVFEFPDSKHINELTRYYNLVLKEKEVFIEESNL